MGEYTTDFYSGVYPILVQRSRIMSAEETEYDTLSLRNRDVVEIYSPVSALGQDKAEEFDELQLRNRTVTETLSPVEDLGQDRKQEEGSKENEKAALSGNGENASNGDPPVNPEDFDKLELRNRTVTETLSTVEDLGQDRENEKKSSPVKSKDPEKEEEYDTLHLRDRVITETLSPVEDLGQTPPAKKQKYDTLELRTRDVTETLSPMDN